MELKAPILLDEREARGVAQKKGLLVVGTMGLLERAASKGLVKLSEVLQALQKTNMRIHPSLVRAALQRQMDVRSKPPSQGRIE